jgi:selenoprotein W-related protein
VGSSGGVFEVTADDQLIFSKKAQGRFPEDEEVLGPLRDRLGTS